MNTHPYSRRRASTLLLALLGGNAGLSQAQVLKSNKGVSMQAKGLFDVKLANQPAAPGTEAAGLGRRSLDKQFHGELDAHSLGEMLAAGTAQPGSAGYVAMEKITGTLHGKRGSFVMMHFGVMDRGQASLQCRVVPDSGTDELLGLTGTMQIEIAGGQHHYAFDYELSV